ncbi:MAG: hypothetical protein AB7I35_05670 [Ramlibacter sp.]
MRHCLAVILACSAAAALAQSPLPAEPSAAAAAAETGPHSLRQWLGKATAGAADGPARRLSADERAALREQLRQLAVRRGKPARAGQPPQPP